jgi:hypothetical protein
MSTKPRIRRSVLLALREAAPAQLDASARAAVGAKVSGEALEVWDADRPLLAEWYDERTSVVLVEALHAVLPTPAFPVFVQELCNNGFGKLRRLFLSLATPTMLANRAPDFWAYDHTTGKMTSELVEGGVIVTIVDHPYVESTSCRVLMTEFMRHAVSLTRVRRVTASDQGARDRLGVLVRWS